MEFHIGKIELVANTGTYLDSPFHRYAEGKDLSELPLESTVDLPAVSVRTSAAAVGAEAFHGLDIAGKAVLVETGWSRHWNTERYLGGHPFFTESAALYLRDNGARLVGIDSLNIDDTGDKRRPVHSILLGAEIPVVEHMTNLAALPETNFRFFAAPVKVKNLAPSPSAPSPSSDPSKSRFALARLIDTAKRINLLNLPTPPHNGYGVPSNYE